MVPLDDATLGEVDQVLTDFERILQYSTSLGLQLNAAKCERIFSGMDGTQQFTARLKLLHTHDAFYLLQNCYFTSQFLFEGYLPCIPGMLLPTNLRDSNGISCLLLLQTW